ncbi:hypothetical protein ACFRAI_22035 [Streptomyces sp. NPDC056637]|uniref:hypothetical protein n=1 Tax=unclassified Streptomyces TaxID=2593676 RepID=UPI0036765BB7
MRTVDLAQATDEGLTLSGEFADVAERATTARLTGLLEHALGTDRAGFDLP